MSENKVEVTSKQFWLNAKDFVKGMLMAIGGSAFIVIENTLNAGVANINWRTVVIAGLASGTTYLVKNFFSPPAVKQIITNDEVADIKQDNTTAK